MPKIEWTRDLETGIPEIDNQHKQLFSYINDLAVSIHEKKTEEVIRKTIQSLLNYVIEHFAAEEKLMVKEGYINYLEHKSLHQKLVIETAEVVEKYFNKELVMTTQLTTFLNNWINDHIKQEDMKFIKWRAPK